MEMYIVLADYTVHDGDVHLGTKCRSALPP